MTSTNTARRVVLYARVSHSRHGSKSVPDQLSELHAWCARERWQIVAEHFDNGISASRYANGRARPGWQQTMDTIAAGGIDVLAVWELSRASRDRTVFAALLAQCADADVLIATGGRLHDVNDPDEGFMIGLGGELAVRESSATSKRTKRAVESRAARGKPHCALPYGYRRVCDSTTGVTLRWEIDPEPAAVVTEIVRRLLAREPSGGIARDLNRRGILSPHGRRWRDNLVRKLALRPALAALREYHGQVLEDVKASWPAIVSEADHHALVTLFADPSRDRWRSPTHIKYLGSGLYRCGRDGCDGRMRVVIEAGRRNRYDCRECHRVSRLQDPVDEWVTAVLIARLSRPDALELLTAGDDPSVSEATAEVARLRAKIAKARQLVDADRLSLESLADLEARTLPRIREAQRRAQGRSLPAAVIEATGAGADAAWAAAPISDRRAILDALMVVTILPAARLFQPFDPDSVRIEWRS